MKSAGRAPLPRRAKSRGVALVELALSLIFLVPLMLGMLNFGYYFYVASNVEEAARAGAREAALSPAGNCAGAGFPMPDPRAAAIELPATVSGQLCNATGGDAACYLHQPPLMLGGAANITVTADCLTPATVPAAPVNPTWRVTVQVDFPLPHPFLFPLLKHSTRTSGWVYYTASETSSAPP